MTAGTQIRAQVTKSPAKLAKPQHEKRAAVVKNLGTTGQQAKEAYLDDLITVNNLFRQRKPSIRQNTRKHSGTPSVKKPRPNTQQAEQRVKHQILKSMKVRINPNDCMSKQADCVAEVVWQVDGNTIQNQISTVDLRKFPNQGPTSDKVHQITQLISRKIRESYQQRIKRKMNQQQRQLLFVDKRAEIEDLLIKRQRCVKESEAEACKIEELARLTKSTAQKETASSFAPIKQSLAQLPVEKQLVFFKSQHCANSVDLLGHRPKTTIAMQNRQYENFQGLCAKSMIKVSGLTGDSFQNVHETHNSSMQSRLAAHMDFS